MKKIFASLALCLFLLPGISVAQIDIKDTGLIDTGERIYGAEQTNENIGTYIGEKIINPIFALLGIIFLVLFIYGGILWMMGGGNPGSIEKAKQVLVNTLIGLLIVMVSYGFTQYVFSAINDNSTSSLGGPSSDAMTRPSSGGITGPSDDAMTRPDQP